MPRLEYESGLVMQGSEVLACPVSLDWHPPFDPSDEDRQAMWLRIKRSTNWLQSTAVPAHLFSEARLRYDETPIGTVAFTTFSPDINGENWAMINDMALREEYRGQGLGMASVIATMLSINEAADCKVIPAAHPSKVGRAIFSKLLEQGLLGGDQGSVYAAREELWGFTDHTPAMWCTLPVNDLQMPWQRQISSIADQA